VLHRIGVGAQDHVIEEDLDRAGAAQGIDRAGPVQVIWRAEPVAVQFEVREPVGEAAPTEPATVSAASFSFRAYTWAACRATASRQAAWTLTSPD
jgi:hypothetical protein